MVCPDPDIQLYHTKRYKGTTTKIKVSYNGASLYHTKRYKGTTTIRVQPRIRPDYIIPKDIRELRRSASRLDIAGDYIIPKDIRELRLAGRALSIGFYYIIPKDIRELRQRPLLNHYL